MQRELLIGLAGIKGSGKSTVAAMLVEMVPNLSVVAWADALKDDVAAWTLCQTGILFSREEMEGLKGEIYGPIFQGYGALMRKYMGINHWIERWDQVAPSRVIVPDCRHHNEAEFIKANGGVLIYIDGPSRWEGDTRSSTHESERFIPELRTKASYIIDNNGTLDSLRDQVAMLASIIAEDGARVVSAA